MTLPELLLWARERWEAEMPVRMHVRALDDGGAPDWSQQFRNWLEQSPSAARNEDVVGERCIHPQHSHKDRKHYEQALLNGLGTDGLRCPDCDESGLRQRTVRRYRWPMRNCVAELHDRRVPKGYPRFSSVLWQLALNDWNTGLACRNLAVDWPIMATRRGPAWIATTLRVAQRNFREFALAA